MTEREKEEVEQILEGCLREDRRAQHRLYEMFYGKLMAACLRYAKDSDDAQDILQEGLVKVFNNIKKFNQTGSFEGWMKRIVVNTAIDYYRKNKKIKYQFDSEHIEKISDTNQEEEENNENDYLDIKPQQIVEEVQKLSPAYRTVFNLYIVEGYTHKEIGELLGISDGTSKSNLAKAKRNLKKAFENYGKAR